MRLLKYILFRNFLSFLLTLAGIVDIGIGVFIVLDIIPVEASSLILSYIFCFAIGSIYFAAGIMIAMVKLKKEK